MIKLKSLLKENDNILSSNQWKEINKLLHKNYHSISRMEYDNERRGQFIRVVFDEYRDAYNFYYEGWELLEPIVDVYQTQSGGPKRWLGGVRYVVSYKINDYQN